jgi:hypothetical protein
MARSNAGKWVARAGATGGSRSYRGNTPVNWYAALVLIVVLGVASVVFSNYEYRHGTAGGTSTTPPTVKTTWYVGLAFDICGAQHANLASNVSKTKPTTQSFFTTGTGVITVEPRNSSAAGRNAVLGRFVKGYPGLSLTATALKLPGTAQVTTSTKKPKTTVVKPVTYKNGEKCTTGKDAGKAGHLEVYSWKSAFASKEKPTVVQGDPNTLRFSSNQLITIGFVPPGTKLPKPNGSVVTALLDAAEGTSSTPSSLPSTISTVPTTATTAPSTSSATTAPPTTVPPTTVPPTTAPATTAPATTAPTSKTKPTSTKKK